MNPILETIVSHVESGHKITRVTVDKRHNPSKVICEFGDGSREETPVECDHKTFMDWWKVTGSYIRLMRLIKPLDELESDS